LTRAANVTIGTAARLTGIEPWRLRRWERSGLLQPLRSPSGYRLYRPADLERARELQRAAADGDRMGLYALAASGDHDVTEGRTPAAAATATHGGSNGGERRAFGRVAEDTVRWAVERSGALWGALILPGNAEPEGGLEVVAVVGRRDLRGYALDADENRAWRTALRHDALLASPKLAALAAGDSMAAPLWIANLRGALVIGGAGDAPIAELMTPIGLTLEQALARDRASEGLDSHDREARLLRRLVQDLASATDVEAACDAALDAVMDMLDAESGAVSLADPTRQRYVLGAHRGLSEHYVAGIAAWKLDEGIAGRAFASREPVIVPDLQADPRVTRRAVRQEGLRAFVAVPMLNRGRAVGVLEVFSHARRRFGQPQIDFTMSVAASLALAVVSLDVEGHLERMRADRAHVLREWSGQVAATGEQERQHFAERLTNEVLEPLRVADGQLADRLAELVDELRTPAAPRTDVVSALREGAVGRLQAETGRAVELVVGDGWPPELPATLSARVHALATTLLEAAARSASTRARLTLAGGPHGALALEIADDRETDEDVVAAIPAGAEPQLVGLEAVAEPGVPGPGLGSVLRVMIPTGPHAQLAALTTQQRTVLRSLARGAPNRAIADELGISPKTLQNHLTTIYRKLGVSSRGQAIPYAVALTDGSLGPS
jgi:DNA-binding CsgD family transcriptional regulator/GAF domain-containing protein